LDGINYYSKLDDSGERYPNITYLAVGARGAEDAE
jgi:hypothetical protein